MLYIYSNWVLSVCVVCVCVCVCVCARTNSNVVTQSTVLVSGPMALHAWTSVNVSSGQWLMLSLPSPLNAHPRRIYTSPKFVYMLLVNTNASTHTHTLWMVLLHIKQLQQLTTTIASSNSCNLCIITSPKWLMHVHISCNAITEHHTPPPSSHGSCNPIDEYPMHSGGHADVKIRLHGAPLSLGPCYLLLAHPLNGGHVASAGCGKYNTSMHIWL